MKTFHEIFDSWLTKAAGVVFVLMVALIIFNTTSNVAQDHPLIGVLVFSLVPILFVVGGLIFLLAIFSLI